MNEGWCLHWSKLYFAMLNRTEKILCYFIITFLLLCNFFFSFLIQRLKSNFCLQPILFRIVTYSLVKYVKCICMSRKLWLVVFTFMHHSTVYQHEAGYKQNKSITVLKCINCVLINVNKMLIIVIYISSRPPECIAIVRNPVTFPGRQSDCLNIFPGCEWVSYKLPPCENPELSTSNRFPTSRRPTLSRTRPTSPVPCKGT